MRKDNETIGKEVEYLQLYKSRAGCDSHHKAVVYEVTDDTITLIHKTGVKYIFDKQSGIGITNSQQSLL